LPKKAAARWVGSLFPQNECCPCGSGLKYERCCSSKGVQCFLHDESREIVRSVPLNAEAREELGNALAVQREKFVAKFGREPGPDDPIFFFDLDEGKVREDTATRCALLASHLR
jgi:hypothetical protein